MSTRASSASEEREVVAAGADVRVVPPLQKARGRLDHGMLVDPPPCVRQLLRREAAYRRLLATADSLAVLIAVLVGAAVFGVAIRWTVILTVPLAVLVWKVQGLYDREEMVIRKSTIAEWRIVMVAAALTSICVYLGWRLLTTAPRGDGMRLFVLLVATLVLVDVIDRSVVRRVARLLTPADRCLIVGDLSRSGHLAKTIAAVDGVEMIGAVTLSDLTNPTEDLRTVVTDLGVHRLVIVPGSHAADSSTLELVRSAKLIGVRVSIVPSILAAVGGYGLFDELDGHTLLGVPRFGLTRSSFVIKRGFDVVGSLLVLLLLAPIIAAIAVLIRVDSTGPVLFVQARVGRDGRLFRMYKFRSMVDGADRMKATLLDHNEASDGLFKITQDPRITRAGRLLRRTHLDELPQLLNVLRGEMSLVGPRPLVAEEDRRILGVDRIRLSLTPGLTGPWQICGPLTTPLSEMVKLDYLYISNWSLWRDIDILLRTAIRVVTRTGV